MDIASTLNDSSEIIMNSVTGINYVRPPTLNFQVLSETKDYTEYLIITDKDSQKNEGSNPFTNNLNSFIFCNDSIIIKAPKKSFMIKNNKKKFAYAIGMFPNPKNKKAAYLDGCILTALGLKRQKTNADVICFITHDISKKDKKKLEVVFDKVMYVPYISPYDMGGKGDLKTIMLDKDLFNNCPNYTKNHPYVHVFFKLHIFNPDLFPYEKVCFVDSDLVPLNYYDSLFMLDCPAGFVEYRKKTPYLEAFHWDRCDFLEHGKKIPKPLTDIDKPTGADVNAGLLLVKPDKEEYDAMIRELTSPLQSWMGPDKIHRGFYSFDFDSPTGMKFIENSYCYPEQNYLTKRFSGKWTFIEFAFQSWALDPCNSFGIHMAAFNPKPWFKQPIGTNLKVNEEYQPYLKKINRMPIAIKEGSNESYENISYSYEIFNEVIIWGLVNFPKLINFFIHETEIHGIKISFDRDSFKKLSPRQNIDFKLLKDIQKNESIYRRLSPSQKIITDLINHYDKSIKKIKDNYLNICKQKTKNKYGKIKYDFQIVNYPEYNDRDINKREKLLKQNKMPFGKNKGKLIKNLNKKYIKSLRKNKKFKNDPDLIQKINKFHTISTGKSRSRTTRSRGGGKRVKTKKKKKKKKKKKETEYICYTGIGAKGNGTYTKQDFLYTMKKDGHGPINKKKPKTIKQWMNFTGAQKGKCKPTLYYFTMKKCSFCQQFNPIWEKIEKDLKNKLNMVKFDSKELEDSGWLRDKFNVKLFPTIILQPLHNLNEDPIHHYFNGDRTEKNIKKFINDHINDHTTIKKE